MYDPSSVTDINHSHCMSHIVRLPHEIFLSIFKHLDTFAHSHVGANDSCQDILRDLFQCAVVNRAFYAATMPLLWRSPNSAIPMPWYSSLETFTFLDCLESSSRPAHLVRHIRRLDFHSSDVMDRIVPFLSCMSLLEELRISSISTSGTIGLMGLVNTALRQEILPLCPRLKSISFNSFTFSPQTLVALSQECRHIEALVLDSCVGMSDADLESLFASYHSTLTTLTFRYEIWCYPFNRHVDLFQLQKLTHLSLTNFPGMGIDFFRYGRFPHLKDCHIRDKEAVRFSSDAAGILLTFLCAHPLLQRLTLSQCRVGNRALSGMTPAVIPRLHYLNLSGNGRRFSPQILRRLVRKCPELSTVCLHGCHLASQSFAEVSQKPVGTLSRDDIIKIRLSDLDLGATTDESDESDDLQAS
ncbi:hypothetical protein [Absidia glauca]|uniref:F-box domain-containing protein n=1 Tax=Absidia glauca TaxID=4829 RepID=A0A168TCH3_ABSGL|nr:hypothetical protein [Absidia glauca]